MLDQTPEAAAVLAGSWTPLVQVDAWYDGELVLENVPITAAATNEDASQAILGSGEITAASPDGTLIPTAWDSPLACYGSELHIRVGIPLPTPEWYSLGWFVIGDFECNDWWQPYEITSLDGTTATLWAVRGTQVKNSLLDHWELIDQATFAVPEQPAQLASVITEIGRLADGLVDMADSWSALTDAAIPAETTYSNSRTEAIQQLAALLSVTARVNRDGALDYTPTTPGTTPVWKVSVTADDQVARILAYTRKGDRTGLFNQFVSAGQSLGGTPVQGVRTTDSGPLRFGGPLGQLPRLSTTNPMLLTTDTACQADADAAQAKYGGAQTVLIPVTVPANPALETNDVIELDLPNNLVLTGPVLTIARSDLHAPTMDVQVQISRTALWGAAA